VGKNQKGAAGIATGAFAGRILTCALRGKSLYFYVMQSKAQVLTSTVAPAATPAPTTSHRSTSTLLAGLLLRASAQ
jgi:hypothetical protein